MKPKTIFAFANVKPTTSAIIQAVEELDLSDIPMTHGIPKELIRIYMYIALQGSSDFTTAKNLVNAVLKNTSTSSDSISRLESMILRIMDTPMRDTYNTFTYLKMDKLISVGSTFFNTLYYYFKCITLRGFAVPKEVGVTKLGTIYTTLDDTDESNYKGTYAGVTAFSLQTCPIDLFFANTIVINDTLPPTIIESKENIIQIVKYYLYEYMEETEQYYLTHDVKVVIPNFQLRKDAYETH